MIKYKLGILGTADIAYRRFLPSLLKNNNIEYIGVASRNLDKTEKFVKEFGGKGYPSYEKLIEDNDIDIVYIPLPPALHYEWGKKALLANKNVFMEKPFCINYSQAKDLCNIAKLRGLVVYENYMFLRHKQLDVIKNYINKIGKIRLIRIAFGFPNRGNNDFRYNKILGGGALLDCGGYTVKLANELLGNSIRLKYVNLNNENCEVDIYGNAAFTNDDNLTAQVAFGMDNAYKCELEIWGEKGIIKAPRIFTAPFDYDVNIVVEFNGKLENVLVGKDDQFYNSIKYFEECLYDKKKLLNEIDNVLQQSKMITLMTGDEI